MKLKRLPSRKIAKAPAGGGLRPTISEAESSVTFELDAASEGLEPVLGAAYLLTDRAYAALDGDRAKTLRVTLRSKRPAGKGELEALGACFLAELETQKVRWAIARNNLPVREFVAEQAVLLANGQLPPPPGPSQPLPEELTADQRQEIDKLIAEVEEEIKAINQKKTISDPKGIKATWEEKQETKSVEAKP